MQELDAGNVVAYLVERGILGRDESADVETCGWGVSNVVLRVRVPALGASASTCRCFVLKQSRRQLRTAHRWVSRLDRVFREREAMEVLAPLLPPLTIPRILFEDRANYLFVMACAPQDHVVWKETLLSGEADVSVAQLAGQILGRMHADTLDDRVLAERLGDTEVFVQLRVDPFYRRIAQQFTDVADTIETLIERMFATKLSLVHADFSPKNMLVHSRGMTLVDFETAHYGDPAFDVGFLLSHLVLKAFRHVEKREAYFELTRTFWRAYREMIAARAGGGALSAEDFTSRWVAHCAGCAWARIDGTSPVDYLPEPARRAAVRTLCRDALLEPFTTWDSVLDRADDLLAHL